MNASECTLSNFLLRFQRRRRTIRMQLGVPDISTTEAHILFALDETRPITAAEVASSIGVEKSVLSRAIHKLQERGFLLSQRSVSDARRFNLTLLPAGRLMLDKLDSTQEQILAICLSDLAHSEIDALARYIRRIADALNSPRFISRLTDHPLTYQLRRLNAVLDKEGADSIPLMNFHLLDCLAERNNWLSVSELSASIGEELSMVSRALTQLSEQGFITKRTNPNDARSSQYFILKDGAAKLSAFDNKRNKKLVKALAMWKDGERQQLCRLLELCAQPQDAKQAPLIEERATLQAVKTEEELSAARAFYVEQVMRNGQLALLSDILFSEDSLTYVYRRNSITRSVCAFEPPNMKQKAWRLCCLASNLSDAETDDKVLRPISEMITNFHKILDIIFSDKTVSPERALEIQTLFSKAGTKFIAGQEGLVGIP